MLVLEKGIGWDFSEVSGDAAILIDPANSKELVDAINRLKSDSKYRDELIKKGLKNVKKFSWKKTAKQTLNVFEEIKM